MTLERVSSKSELKGLTGLIQVCPLPACYDWSLSLLLLVLLLITITYTTVLVTMDSVNVDHITKVLYM